jgi:hypothetical protein
MSIPSDYNKENEAVSPLNLEDTLAPTSSPTKSIILVLAFLAFIVSIFALLPMFFTYLSEGDIRAPSEFHATDSAIKLSLQNSSYSHNPVVLEKQTVPPKKYYNNLPME